METKKIEAALESCRKGETYLQLSGLGLTQLPEEVRGMKWIEALILDDNPLGSLPEWICELPSLYMICATGCQLPGLPKTIAKCRNLDTLRISQNPLKVLPVGIRDLARLKELEAFCTGLTEFPLDVLNISTLTHLYLDENSIKSVPESVSRLSKLAYLGLSNCDLIALPGSLAKLRLKKLDVRDNPLSRESQRLAALQD